MKKTAVLLIAILMAFALSGCDKYTKEQLDDYANTVAEKIGLTSETGLNKVHIDEENKKLHIIVLLKEPITADDFKGQCSKIAEAINNNVNWKDFRQLSVYLSKNGETLLYWDTTDLKTGWVIDYSKAVVTTEKMTISKTKIINRNYKPDGKNPSGFLMLKNSCAAYYNKFGGVNMKDFEYLGLTFSLMQSE